MASIGQKLGASDTLRGPDAATGLNLTAGRLRHWGVKSALSLVDQGFTSGAGFLVNLLLARWMPAPVYGAFAVAFAGFLFISGFHNVLLLEPLSVLGPPRHAKNLLEYFEAQLRIHALLVGVLSVVVLAVSAAVWVVSPASPLVGAMVGVGLTLPFLLLLWLVRRMCYVVQKPAVAVGGSAFYLVFVAAGLVVLVRVGWLGSFAAFVLMGVGSAAAAFVLWRGIVHEETSAGTTSLSWQEILKENWSYGKWLVGSNVLFSISNQIQIFFVSAALGIGAAGVLRAMQVPALVVFQLITAAGLLLLPSLSYDFGSNRIEQLRMKAIGMGVGLSMASLVVAWMVAKMSFPLERLLYGGKFAGDARLMAVFVLGMASLGCVQGFGMGLRALQKPQYDLLSNGVAAPVAAASVYFFVREWGLSGAAWSIAITFTTQGLLTLLCFLRCLQELPSRGAANRDLRQE